MKKRLLVTIILLATGAFLLRAQDYPVTPLDGPSIKPDSLEINAQTPAPPFMPLHFPNRISMIHPLPVPEFETKEQRAARLNAAAFNSVMTSVDNTLYWYRLPKYTSTQKWVFFALGLFLSNPFGFQEGYVPMGNSSFPFIYAKVPGMAPYTSPYSAEFFPPTIKTEYDFATGTYKQVMVDWKDYQKQLSQRIPLYLNSAPIPKVSLTPVERMMNNL